MTSCAPPRCRTASFRLASSRDRLSLCKLHRVQTLWVRAKHADAEAMTFPPADLLVIDEAHHCPARTYRQIIAAYPDAIVLGLTATPCRGDGRGLGSIFEAIIECPQVPDLIEQGWLVPHARLCAGHARPERREYPARRLRRGPTRRPDG